MAKKKDEDSVVVSAAKAIGKAAGKVAALTGAGAEGQGGEEAAPAPGARRRSAKGKLAKKDKERLPRRLKKAQKKKLQEAR